MEERAFWEIASELASAEERTQALTFLSGARSTFAQVLRGIAPGEVVTFVATDGIAIRGRVLEVGVDHVRVAEVADELGTARRRAVRTHELRLDAVARVVREPEA